MLAVAWHVYLAFLVVLLLVGHRGSRRVWGVLLALPLLSVGSLAWYSGNPFNGTLFLIGGFGLIAVAIRLGPSHVKLSRLGFILLGACVFAFGWAYPHFLDTDNNWTYLYAAPTGLVPCPTLSAVIGLSIIIGGLESSAWSILLGVIGLFYGVFGAAHLSVTIDWILAAASVFLLATAILSSRWPEHKH